MVEVATEPPPPPPAVPLPPASASLAFSLRLSRVVFFIGCATPVVLALVTAPTLPPPVAKEEEARPKRGPLGASRLTPPQPSQFCRISAPPELNLHYSCQRAAPECWSTYWWGLTLPLELPSSDPPVPPLSVTVRAGAGSWAEARELEGRLAAERRLPCSVDASGAVRVLESGGPLANATALHLAGGERAGNEAMPLPLGVLLATAAWNALLEGLGATPRAPPPWFIQGVWLRLCSPGVPLVTLSSFTHLVHRRGGPPRVSSAHAALLTPAMLAATAEAASLLLGECRRSLAVRRLAQLTPAPVFLGLALLAAAGAAVGRVMLEPAMAEVARCGEAMSVLRMESAAAEPWHPLGPLRSRSLSKENLRAMVERTWGESNSAVREAGEVGPAACTRSQARQQASRRVELDMDS